VYARAFSGRCHGIAYFCFPDSESFGWGLAGRLLVEKFYSDLFSTFAPEGFPLDNKLFVVAWQDDFMNFIIMFMASPNFIRNPYLRAKMVEVLNCWMPRRRSFVIFHFFFN
jgi:hypothetical protein